MQINNEIDRVFLTGQNEETALYRNNAGGAKQRTRKRHQVFSSEVLPQ